MSWELFVKTFTFVCCLAWLVLQTNLRQMLGLARHARKKYNHSSPWKWVLREKRTDLGKCYCCHPAEQPQFHHKAEKKTLSDYKKNICISSDLYHVYTGTNKEEVDVTFFSESSGNFPCPESCGSINLVNFPSPLKKGAVIKKLKTLWSHGENFRTFR